MAMKILLFILCLPAFAISQEIDFKQDLSIQELQTLAQKENKKIFVDCWASWCGWCTELNRTTFKDETVVNLLSENFINVKINMDNDIGGEYGWQFDVSGLPALLYIDENGELIKKIDGYLDAESFASETYYILHPEEHPLTMAKNQYLAASKDRNSIYSYTQQLIENEQDATHLIAAYKSIRPKYDLTDTMDLDMLYYEIEDLNHPLVPELIEEYDLIESKYPGRAFVFVDFFIKKYAFEAVEMEDETIITNTLFPFLDQILAHEDEVDLDVLKLEIKEFYQSNS